MTKISWSTHAYTLLAVGALTATTFGQKASFGPAEQLTGDDAAFTGIYYPSPTLHDLDADGKRELVVGDLRGYVQFSEKLDGGALAWSKLANVKMGDKPLKLFNW